MMRVPFSEQELISSASKGDLDAFNQLVLNYQDIVYNYASGLGNDPDSAQDISQESFLKAFQNLDKYRGWSFRAWLLKIVTNISNDLWRRRKRHSILPLFRENEAGQEIESPAWLADRSPSIETIVQRNEISHDLYQFLDELPASYRCVIILIDLYEMDYTEAAQILHIPLGTVKSRLARARMQMKNKLQGELNTSLSWAHDNVQ